ncbi:MAG: addiction module protein [Myxococcales bacterium]|nr:addiction module protein [Myxococcales bacterium]
MGAEARRLLDQALALPDDDRRAFVEELIRSLQGIPVELAPAWRGELEGRIAELERGDVQAVPWADVEDKIAQVLADS